MESEAVLQLLAHVKLVTQRGGEPMVKKISAHPPPLTSAARATAAGEPRAWMGSASPKSMALVEIGTEGGRSREGIEVTVSHYYKQPL
jgi:hypothetical protein